MDYKEIDYKEIVLNGFINNREYLDRYFIRKFKEAESQNYFIDEFFKGCLNVVSEMYLDVKKQYYDEKGENQECLKIAISTNDKEAENQFREQLNELNECNYSVHLYSFTGKKFHGYLFSEDIKYIALSIGLALKTIQEQTPATSSKPEPPATIEKNKEIFNPYQRYFKEPEYWQLFNDWHHLFINNKLVDYSFIYRVMWADGFIYKDIGQNDFKIWIEETFLTGNLGKQLKQLDIAKTNQKFNLYASLIDKYKLISITLQKRSKNTTKT